VSLLEELSGEGAQEAIKAAKAAASTNKSDALKFI
jgi:hypothetical protein